MPRHPAEIRETAIATTRQKLLEAAAQEFARQGYSQANVNLIAKQAGYSIGTFYNYFPSKRALMHAFIEEFSNLHVSFISDRVLQENDPQRRLEIFFEAGFAFIQANIIQAKAIFNTLNGPDEEFKQQLFQAYQPLFLAVKEILESGTSQQIFHIPHLEAAVNLIMLIYLGTGAQLSPQGKHWLEPAHISGFILSSLRYQNKE